MLSWLWLVPALPLAGFVILAFGGGTLSRRGAGVVGVGSMGLSAAVAMGVGLRFLTAPGEVHAYTQVLWTWFESAPFSAEVALYLDPLSLVMMLVVTGVGFLIHVYSVAYMADDAGYARFFAYMNLFVASMLVLVLGDNLLLLYLGWEGVGLCSYLLIGFWYEEPANGRAAMKAFLVTRVGDTAMAIALFILFIAFETLNIQGVMQAAAGAWPAGSMIAAVTAALLLGGAVGKSGQLPLQVWLPDAMAGPTPVSALIHAATMVTAGVYLIARMHVLFELAPLVQLLVGMLGGVTLLLAGCSALVQTDIKRALAYSTISQIGYMFLGLGVGAWPAAIFHFMTHAFFKALLFMGAGAVILGLHHEQDMRKMGGLRERLPLVFKTFVVGAASLAALPLVTAGFYSKDLILLHAFDPHAPWLWLMGAAGAFLTGLYSFRMVFLTFFGEPRGHHADAARQSRFLTAPLVVLAVLAAVGGLLEIPRTLGDMPAFTRFMAPALPLAEGHHPSLALELVLQLATASLALGGLGAAYALYVRRPEWPARVAGMRWADGVRRFWLAGWGFDWVYERLFVRPYVALTQLDKDDVVDSAYGGLARGTVAFHEALSRTQTGRLRWYMMGIAAGAAATLAIVIWL